MTLYKVLGPDGASLHGGDLVWSLPTDNVDGTWTPGDWHEVAPPIMVCERGLHLTTAPWDRWVDRIDATVYEVEGGGDFSTKGDDKTAYQRARLLRPVLPEWWVSVQRFVREEIPAIPWLRPDGDPDPAWRLFVAPTWREARAAAYAAAYDAERDANRDAAYNANRDAAYNANRDAAYNADRAAATSAAYNAARAAVRAAVRAAAYNAARAAAYAAYAAYDAAAYDATHDAERDAALAALVLHVCADLPIEERHLQTAREQWRVWQKGYGLAAEVAGVLYVYAELKALGQALEADELAFAPIERPWLEARDDQDDLDDQ